MGLASALVAHGLSCCQQPVSLIKALGECVHRTAARPVATHAVRRVVCKLRQRCEMQVKLVWCSSLNHFTLHYGMRDVGMDYDRAVFGMKLSDCRSLARCLEYCETLVSLDLSCNLLDDDKLRMLASGLVNNLSVVDINLADNRIADRGVRAFAKLLHVNSVIQIVNLSNNQVRT